MDTLETLFRCLMLMPHEAEIRAAWNSCEDATLLLQILGRVGPPEYLHKALLACIGCAIGEAEPDCDLRSFYLAIKCFGFQSRGQSVEELFLEMDAPEGPAKRLCACLVARLKNKQNKPATDEEIEMVASLDAQYPGECASEILNVVSAEDLLDCVQ